MTTPATRVMTFAPMIDSETVRLLLRHYGIAYVEEDHLFGWVSILTMLAGGGPAIPFVKGGGLKLTGPFPLAQQCDAKLAEADKLIPTIGPLAGAIAADWKRFNGDLGTDVAVFAYFHLMPERAQMQPIFADPVPRCEAWALSWAYPLLNFLFKMGLKLSPDHAAQAETNIRAVFDEVDQRIKDGRRHLCGDRLTLGDVAFSASSAPLLLPDGYGAKMPPLEAMPAPVKRLAHELREHPAAAFVDRFYREQVRDLA